MKILFSLTYYHPHISGLTIAAKRLAEGLAARGHTVTVITSQHRRDLPPEQILGGVRIVRVPVRMHVSKGAIMPGFPAIAWQLLSNHDVAVLNLPNTFIEALSLASFSRVQQKGLLAIYHCDLHLPDGFINRMIDSGVFLINIAVGSMADEIVTHSSDYALHSRFLRIFTHKVSVISPPVRIARARPNEAKRFRARHGLENNVVIGLVARLAAEKGVDHMARALALLQREIPGVTLLFVGEHEAVIGEEKYRDHIHSLTESLGDSWRFLGMLPDSEMSSFFTACNVTVLPSINKTESFGLVQLESMLCGTPVVASNLPGIRVPLEATGMGKLVAPGNPKALAEGILEVVRHRNSFVLPRPEVEERFSYDSTITRYEHKLMRLVKPQEKKHTEKRPIFDEPGVEGHRQRGTA